MTDDRLDRWRKTQPTPTGCTWGISVTGTAFVDAMDACGYDGGSVLEVGPGYGRLWLAAKERFQRVAWTGVDLSPAVVAYCEGLGMRAVLGNAASDPLPEADAGVASLVFKHQFPDFSAMLANMLRSVTTVYFDVPEAPHPVFIPEDDPTTGYLRGYTDDEIRGFVTSAGGVVEHLTYVDHGTGPRRFVAVSRP